MSKTKTYKTAIKLAVDHIVSICTGNLGVLDTFARAAQRKYKDKFKEDVIDEYAGRTNLGTYRTWKLGLANAHQNPPAAITLRRVKDRLDELAQSLLNCIKDATENPKGSSSPGKFKDHETFLFGDVHGNARGLLQSMWMAGIVGGKTVGFDFSSGATIISVGDLIDRGMYSMEAVLLFLSLQLAAESVDATGGVVRLIGNHELACMWGNGYTWPHTLTPMDTAILRLVYEQDIKDERVKIAYAAPTAPIFFASHAGIRKHVVLKYTAAKGLTVKHGNKVKRFFGAKPRLSHYYKEIAKGDDKDEGLVIAWLNEQFRDDAIAGKFRGSKRAMGTQQTSVLYGGGVGDKGSKEKEKSSSVVWSKYWTTKLNSRFAGRLNKGKPVQFVGHMIMKKGHVLRRHNVFFIDTGLFSKGSQEFVGIKDKNIFVLRNKGPYGKTDIEPGLDKFPQLNPAKWTSKKISKLPG